MLKIESARTTDGRLKLVIEGRVIGPWVVELERACERALAGTAAELTVDLSEVAFVDPDGLELLCGLGRRGVRLDCSGFVAEQLKARGCR